MTDMEKFKKLMQNDPLFKKQYFDELYAKARKHINRFGQLEYNETGITVNALYLKLKKSNRHMFV